MKQFFRYSLTFLVSLTATFISSAQAPTWQSVISAGQVSNSNSRSSVTATAADASGNVYVTGTFSGTASFGNTTLTSSGSSDDVFIAKWNTTSNAFAWALRVGGTGAEDVAAIALSGASVYIVGGFASATANFGTITLANAGSSTDAYIAKLTDAGSSASFTWVQRAGGTSFETASSLAVNGANLYVGGVFNGATVSIGATTLLNASASSTDLFVAKLTDAGSSSSFTWALRCGSAGQDYASGIAVNGTNVYFTGEFMGTTANFGGITLANAAIASPSEDVFIAKATDTGGAATWTWAQRAGGSGHENARGIAVNGSNIYVAGHFDSNAFQAGSNTLTNLGGNNTLDLFVAKLVDAGSTSSFTWAQRGGYNDDFMRSLAVSGTSIYIAGGFYGATTVLGSTTLTNGSGVAVNDLFIARLADAGPTSSFTWALRAGGVGYEFPSAVAIAGARIYVAGNADTPAAFGSQTLTGPSASSIGFLASLTDPLLSAVFSPLKAELAIYPNPANQVVSVKVPGVPGANKVTLTLLNSVGQIVGEKDMLLPASGLNYDMELNALVSGVYLLRVQAGTAITTRQLTVR